MECQMWLRWLRQLCLRRIIKVHGVVHVLFRWGRLHIARRVIPDPKQKKLPLFT